MKILLNIFEKVKPAFKKGGMFSAFNPLYEAMENFFFAPANTTLTAPHARGPLDLKRYMSMVIIALLPCVAASVYFFGLRVLAMIAVSYAAGGLIEVIFAVVRKEPIAEGFLVTGLIFPLVLPPAIPLWMVAVGVMFGVFFGKELFGGTGRNLFNPALLGRCFLSIAYAKDMAGNWIKPGHGIQGRLFEYVSNANLHELHAVTSATPLTAAKQGTLEDMSHLVLGEIPGSAGETSGILIICGGLFLIFTRVANWRTVAGSLGSAFLFAAVLHSNSERFAPALWHLFAGGLLFGAFFMATDPVSSPVTNTGKWIYGILIGAVTILIRNFTGYVEGVTFAVLLGNIAAPILDEIVVNIRLRRFPVEA